MSIRQTLGLLVFIILFPCCATVQTNTQGDSTEKASPKHIVIECNIYNKQNVKLWSYTGTLCLFYDDGSFVVRNSYSLKKYDSKFTLLWEKNIPLHHQLNKSDDGQSILAMGETYGYFQNKLTRFDTLLVFSTTGKLLKKFSFQENLAELRKLENGEAIEVWPMVKNTRRRPGVVQEISHANSFYEIGDNASAEKDPVFSQGNYLVNLNLPAITIILDKTLTKVLWALPHTDPSWRDKYAHDVQMLRNGKLLSYANRGQKYKFSAIELIDPVARTGRVIYQANPKNSFYSKVAGGVQLLGDGKIFISDITKGPWVHEIDLSTGRKTWSSEFVGGNNIKNYILQQAKQEDLSLFLQNNKGL